MARRDGWHLTTIAVHGISLPLLGLTPPLLTLPWYEYVSEFVGHMVWFWPDRDHPPRPKS